MLRKRIGTGLAILLAMFNIATCSAAHLVDEASVLKGKVVSVVAVGQTVMEGDELARIETLTGSVTAARATVNGTVAVVYVEVGETIRANSVVAQIAVE